MRILTYTHNQKANFGDDLNRWLWPRLFNIQREGAVFLGIGTMLSKNLVPPADHYIVFSSGAGYSPLPEDFGGPKWNVLAVRGPLTAAALGLPPQTAVVDGAVLLRLLPECQPLPIDKRSGVAFMPHVTANDHGEWKKVCDLAGITFLDPHAPSEQTVQAIRRSRIVLANAMHAAIVSDALRVPWIPVSLSPQTNTFKWMDFCLSLGLVYNPVSLPASTRGEAWKNRVGDKYFVDTHWIPEIIEHFHKTIRRKSHKRHVRHFIERIARQTPLPEEESRIATAAKNLSKLTDGCLYLSEDRLFNSKLDRLASLLPAITGR